MGLQHAGTPIYSTINDPDMVELIDMFVAELGNRAARFEQLMLAKNWRDLVIEAHRLRGAAGGHGFADIGLAAGAVEDLLRERVGAEDAALDQVRTLVTNLAAMCRRARVRVAA